MPPKPVPVLLLALTLLLGACQSTPPGEPILIGLIAPLSGPLAASGEAIERGMLLAMDEINGRGGVLGRPLELVTRDVQNEPAVGVAALLELIDQEQIVAVFGGIYSPVMLAQLETVHARRIPLINPWGSMTAITQNGYDPNYAFRVSVSDAAADEFLARYAVEVLGARRPGILADTSGWGSANRAGLLQELEKLGVAPAGVEQFDQGETHMTPQIERLMAQEADALLLVANAAEGAAIVRGMALLGWKVPVVSHWGISGGRFPELTGVQLAEGILTLQTISFQGALSDRGQAVLQAYHTRFGTNRADEIEAPVGVAHGYDGVLLLAQAMIQAQSTEGEAVRTALETLAPVQGLIKEYAPAFTPDRHDALLATDYRMSVWRNGRLVPADQPFLPPR